MLISTLSTKASQPVKTVISEVSVLMRKAGMSPLPRTSTSDVPDAIAEQYLASFSAIAVKSADDEPTIGDPETLSMGDIARKLKISVEDAIAGYRTYNPSAPQLDGTSEISFAEAKAFINAASEPPDKGAIEPSNQGLSNLRMNGANIAENLHAVEASAFNEELNLSASTGYLEGLALWQAKQAGRQAAFMPGHNTRRSQMLANMQRLHAIATATPDQIAESVLGINLGEQQSHCEDIELQIAEMGEIFDPLAFARRQATGGI